MTETWWFRRETMFQPRMPLSLTSAVVSDTLPHQLQSAPSRRDAPGKSSVRVLVSEPMHHAHHAHSSCANRATEACLLEHGQVGKVGPGLKLGFEAALVSAGASVWRVSIGGPGVRRFLAVHWSNRNKAKKSVPDQSRSLLSHPQLHAPSRPPPQSSR